MVSLLEHRIEVLTDDPILNRVPHQTWEDMVTLIQGGFQQGKPVESLCQAIAACGSVLAQAFPVKQDGNNPNELPNELIQDP